MNPRECEIEIRLHVPGQDYPLRRAVKACMKFSGFEPLPVTREIDPMAAAQAMNQQRAREAAASSIVQSLVKSLVPELLALIERGDTINGYTRQEYESLTPQQS